MGFLSSGVMPGELQQMKSELDAAKEKLQYIIPKIAAPKDEGDCFFFFLSVARKLSFLSLFSKLEALQNLTRLFFFLVFWQFSLNFCMHGCLSWRSSPH